MAKAHMHGRSACGLHEHLLKGHGRGVREPLASMHACMHACIIIIIIIIYIWRRWGNGTINP